MRIPKYPFEFSSHEYSLPTLTQSEINKKIKSFVEEMMELPDSKQEFSIFVQGNTMIAVLRRKVGDDFQIDIIVSEDYMRSTLKFDSRTIEIEE